MSWVKSPQDTSLVADVKENSPIGIPEVEEYTDPDFNSSQE